MENIIAKKSLGQNFLKSKTALLKMIEAGEINNEDTVLEVGPGKGVLTEKLLEKAKKVIAVEKDDRLISFLQEKFATEISAGKLQIIHDDILNFDLKRNLTPALSLTNEREKRYKIIANIPYYITGQFLRQFLETDNQPERIVVMVQKEIAQRIIANNPTKAGEKKESLLSMSVKAFGTPKMIMKVDKENFSPAPKVDSAILLISGISKGFFTDNQITEKDFFATIHAGFAHKRKILASNLKSVFPGVDWAERMEKAGLNIKVRAEDLSLVDWMKLISIVI
jgi:16S rRNA (adenine1518-N6/adenine1519-N6)-dimethyltransferase